ncbi:uncharacterized protein LOC127810290 [Diospyros lotus]|uniref:uncharacterized protein LOC127810290 n=1 Tax=Diospyros lotus TaxID=55363 RepID=UPI0022590175|nr:uncharacterized protein LOC127810290 [Diospyros lotus]
MDPIEPARKLLAKEKWKMRQILIKALICSLFCSCPFWFPKLCSSVNHFACVSLPHLKSFFVNPMCLFVVGNAIVVFLVGESKLAAGSSSSSTSTDTHDQEHVCNVEKNHEIEPEMGFGADDKAVNKITEEDEDRDEEEYYSDDCVEEEESDGEEEAAGLATEELNKRAEDLIARVKRQRWLEARLDDCGRG